MTAHHHHHFCEACLSVIGSNQDPIARDCGQLQEHTLGFCYFCYQTVKRLPADQRPGFLAYMQAAGPGMSYQQLEAVTKTYSTT